MITFTLNGKAVEARVGEYILEAAERCGVKIPTLCHHRALEPAGMCRLCTVELFDGRKTRFVTACNYPIWEGMEVRTDTPAVHEGRRLIVELLLARCPEVPLLRELAAAYGIVEPRFEKEADDCILCGLCARICERMGVSAISLTGRGVEMKVDTPFSLLSDTCLGCGACASVCPTGHIRLEKITPLETRAIPSEYDWGLKGRKPLYVPYAQAIPNTPVIDRERCMHFKTGGCRICADVCKVGAIDHTQEEEIQDLTVGAIVLAPGAAPFDPAAYPAYPYGKHPNIVTSTEFERLLSAGGPTMGHLLRRDNGEEPRKIAWIQCVGSRDIHRCDHAYCSSVCCMYAIKQAVIAKEHTPGLDCALFYIDMRTHGKEFETYLEEARDRHGVRFVRSRVPTIDPLPGTEGLRIPYVDERGRARDETFDMVVLSVGLEMPKRTLELAERLGISLTPGGFAASGSFLPVGTSRPGIFACGTFKGPKDIPQSVIEASAAAAEVGAVLAPARNTQTRTRDLPSPRDLRGERPRIGVFVCHCGINIGGIVDVPAVRDYAATLPYVEVVADNLFSCSTDTQEAMTRTIGEKGLNRIVVAACTPKTHEPLFQDTLARAGINRYLFEMTNIRNQDSWVHKADPAGATEKAKDLVRMAVARAALLEPLADIEARVNPGALVIGGGVAGLTAAKTFARQGYPVDLVERTDTLGGQARRLYRTWKGEDVQASVAALVRDVEGDPKIRVHVRTTLAGVEGFVGNFRSLLQGEGGTEVVEHGVAVIATGAGEYRPTAYACGEDPRVLTHLDLDRRLLADDPSLRGLRRAVFIQCVGSREPDRPYCSRVCCTHSLEGALLLKERNPDAQVLVLYRDIRAYGEREYLYRKARETGVLFVPYTLQRKPSVRPEADGIAITVFDTALEREVLFRTDLLILATAIVSHRDETLAQHFKIPMNADGFFVEAHAKLGPSEFATDGVFLCGMAHYPKPIDEAVAQAEAAVARAVTLLSRGTVTVSGMVAGVSPQLCSGCGVCVSICPYSAPTLLTEGPMAGKAQITPVQCKGCGLCVASCRSGAISLKGFEDGQVLAMIEHL